MILRHITDVTHLVEDLGEDGIMPAMGQSQNRDDDQIDAMHIQDDASENLL
jgi:hypothetical protein